MIIKFSSIEIHMLDMAFKKMKEIEIPIYNLNFEGDRLYINDDYIVEFMDLDAICQSMDSEAPIKECNYRFYSRRV